jgi:hypothetical protein
MTYDTTVIMGAVGLGLFVFLFSFFTSWMFKIIQRVISP